MIDLILQAVVEGRCVALKNRKQFVWKHGRYIIIPSENYNVWQRKALESLLIAKGKSKYGFPLAEPIHVEAIFFYDHHPSDLDNAMNSVAEVLEKGGVIVTDNLIESWDGTRRFACEKNKCKTIIRVWKFWEGIKDGDQTWLKIKKSASPLALKRLVELEKAALKKAEQT